MSAVHTDLKGLLHRFLDRRKMPTHLEGKKTAIADEFRALLSALEREAPKDQHQFEKWWKRVETGLGELKPLYWPTLKDIADIVMSLRISPLSRREAEFKINALALAGKRMMEGSDVAETYLYGYSAWRLLQERHVDLTTMTRYRLVAYRDRQAVYGEVLASTWRANSEANHAVISASMADAMNINALEADDGDPRNDCAA